MITINFGPSVADSETLDEETERNKFPRIEAAGMTSTRGLEQDFGQLYMNEPSDGHQPRPAYSSPQRQGPQPFRNGTASAQPPDRPPYPDARAYHNHSGYPSHMNYSSHPSHMAPHTQSHDPRNWHSGAPYRQGVVPTSGGQGHRMLVAGSDPGSHRYGPTQDHASTPTGGSSSRAPNVLLRLRLKAGGGAVINLPEGMGLPSFKPVVYPNPGVQDDSDEEEPPQPQRITQTAGYYRSDAPNTAHQQARLTQIPVQHISSSKQMPNTSQSGIVYSGIASSVPMSRAPNNNQQYRAIQESDYVNAPAAVTSQSSDFYTEEDDFIPPAVPSKVQYGSVSASSYTPEIKGPQYRIAADVYANQPAGYANQPAGYANQPAGIPPNPISSTARSYHGHYPEPVSSKLMYTTPVAPAGQGIVESRLKSNTSSGGPPPPVYDPQPNYGPKDGSMSYPSSYSTPGQAPLPKTGLYDYSTEHSLPPGGGDKKEAEVDALTQMLMQNMEAAADPDFFGPCASCGRHVQGIYNACVALESVYHIGCFRCRLCGMCARCGRSIMGDNAGCSALDQLYHVDCFSCIACGHGLGGQPFFAMEGKPYCETCYMSTLEKCSVCSKPITDRILRATGKPYHPACFTCVVCGKSLDGVPFTVDATNQIHCIEDFHRKFAPRCCVCGEPILPDSGQEETIRIVAMDKSFHVGCYRCEDCGLVLSSEAEGRGCYPLDDHILCKNCNARRIQTLTTKMTTEL